MALFLEKTPVKVCLSLISEQTLRCSVLPVGERVTDVFSALDLDDRVWTEPDCVLTQAGDAVLGEFSVSVTEEPFAVSVFRNGETVQTVTFDADTGDASFPLGSGALFGLGHGYREQPDRRGGNLRPG